jgi:hypothetical protein
MIVAGGRAVWYDTDIKDYLSRLGGELDAVAVSDPNKLALKNSLPTRPKTDASTETAHRRHQDFRPD